MKGNEVYMRYQGYCISVGEDDKPWVSLQLEGDWMVGLDVDTLHKLIEDLTRVREFVEGVEISKSFEGGKDE